MNLAALTLHEAREKLHKREFSAQELTEAVFRRISETEEKLHSYITAQNRHKSLLSSRDPNSGEG